MTPSARPRGAPASPWESGAGGEEITPQSGLSPTGEVLPIRTGELEDHIAADIAWAANCYATWTGDGAFMRGDGRALLVETARFWASRIVFADGRAPIRGVIGLDEHHEDVSDNAYTNVMAR